MPARARGRKRAAPPRPVPELALCGRIWRAGRLESAEVGLDDQGRIVRVGKDLRAVRRHDLGQSVILPSATDLHVHFRDPGSPNEVESPVTGTLAAAFGGVGAVGDMPNTTPPVLTAEDVLEKASRARRRLAVDMLIYAALTDRSRVETVARAAGGFKLYLSPTTGIASPPGWDVLPDLLGQVARTGAPLTVHAEDPRAFRTAPPASDGSSWNAARPPEAEVKAVEALHSAPLALRLHFAHVTSAAVLDLIRSSGWSCEVTPQHLWTPAEEARDARWKVNPPLRPRLEQQKLWESFRSGAVPSYASDHAPHSLEVKRRPWTEAPSGLPGVETAVPLLLNRVRTAELGLGVLIATAADRPARWFGLPMGRIAPGHRGHLLTVDFRQRTRIQASRLHSPCGWTPFEGAEAVFPTEHYHDGELIVDHGEYVGRMNGNVVRPEYVPGGKIAEGSET